MSAEDIKPHDAKLLRAAFAGTQDDVTSRQKSILADRAYIGQGWASCAKDNMTLFLLKGDDIVAELRISNGDFKRLRAEYGYWQRILTNSGKRIKR